MYMSIVFGCFGIDIALIFAHVLNNCYVFVFLQCALRDKGYHGLIMSISHVYKSIALACTCIH